MPLVSQVDVSAFIQQLEAKEDKPKGKLRYSKWMKRI